MYLRISDDGSLILEEIDAGRVGKFGFDFFAGTQKEVALGLGRLRVARIVGSLGICGHGESIVGRIEGKN